MPAAALPLVVLAYLLGTVPTAQLVTRRAGVDPLAEGSGNPGATNVARLAGRRAGALVLAGDVTKGVVATLSGLVVGGRPLALASGLAVIVGHIAPATRWFRGGKGVATSAGVAVVLWPVLSVFLALLWGGVAMVTRRVAVASITVALAAPLAIFLTGGSVVDVVVVGLIGALIVVRHRDNIGRLLAGDEPSLTSRPTSPPTPRVAPSSAHGARAATVLRAPADDHGRKGDEHR